jgi:tetratricopeptide (TPR) repeat protein
MSYSIRGWLLAVAVVLGCSQAARAQDKQMTADEALGKFVQSLVEQSLDSFDADKSKDIVDAVKALASGDVGKARKDLEAAVKAQPGLPPDRILMAHILELNSQPNRDALVRDELEAHVRDAGKDADPEAYYIFARNALAQGRWTDAEVLVDKANSQAKEFKGNDKRKQNFITAAWSDRSAIAEARGRWEDAIKYLQGWINADKKSPAIAQINFRMGNAYFQLKDMEKALLSFKKARELDEKNFPVPEVALAAQYEQAGDHSKAKDQVAAAVKANAKDIETLIAAATWGVSSNEFTLAQQYADMALKIKPESARTNLISGLVARQLKKYADAEKYIRAAFDSDPGDFAATNVYALVLAQQGDKDKLEKALKYARLNVENHQKNAEAHATFAWILHKAGNAQGALQEAGVALQSGNLTADSTYYLAAILEANKKNVEARYLLEKIVGPDSKIKFPDREDAVKLLEKVKEATK